jgi:hypothetical protein
MGQVSEEEGWVMHSLRDWAGDGVMARVRVGYGEDIVKHWVRYWAICWVRDGEMG